jgi:hypothetical protein
MIGRTVMIKWSIVFMIIATLFAGINASADEGMWPLYDLDKLPWDQLKARGLELEPEQIYDPDGDCITDAVIRLGATASFVSSDGLILTNHHVAYGAIQRQSYLDRNYLRDGYYAATRDKEIRAIGSEVRVTLSIDDVTNRVLAAMDESMSDLERHDAIEQVMKEIVAETEAGRDVKCRVAAMHGGLQYKLYTFFEIKDIRIVYAPPLSIGKFGGEIDNWMWPRHTGDFAFFRAYVSPDGSSAEYSEENVPYHPKVFLTISSEGLNEGDLTFMMGFPGKTNRYTSSFKIDNIMNHYFPMSIQTMKERLDILESIAAADSSAAIRLASSITGIHNFYKKNNGVLKGLNKRNALERARNNEKALKVFINSRPELSEKYGNILTDLEELTARELATQDKDYLLSTMNYVCVFLRFANSIYKWAIEREKDDMDREPGYQERDRGKTLRRIRRAQINLLPDVDKTMMRYFLERILDLPDGQKVETFEKLLAGEGGRDRQIGKFLDELYSNTKMGDLEKKLAMFEMSKGELEMIDDSFMELAIALRPELDEQRERKKEFSGAHSLLDPKLAAAYAEWKKGHLYPDAKTVRGFSPADAVEYFHQTGLRGVIDKETGEDPFIVPAELKDNYLKEDYGGYTDPVINDVPVNFLTDNDGTNGNSGSPVLNGRGELIGVDFGNIESVSDDYVYNGEISRSIVVDIRYALFLMDKVYHLDALMKELTIR